MLYSSQEIESRQEAECDHKTSEPASSDPLASARPYFLRFLELFKTVSPAGDMCECDMWYMGVLVCILLLAWIVHLALCSGTAVWSRARWAHPSPDQQHGIRMASFPEACVFLVRREQRMNQLGIHSLFPIPPQTDNG